jgi:hypothetical protein
MHTNEMDRGGGESMKVAGVKQNLMWRIVGEAWMLLMSMS